MPWIFGLVAIVGAAWYIATHTAAVGAVLIGILALTGLWYVFWPAIIGLCIVLAYMVDDRDDHWFGLPLSMLTLFGFIQFSRKFDLVSFARQETLMLLAYVGGYLVVGIVWSTFRVRLMARDIDARHKSEKQKFLAQPGKTEADWLQSLRQYNRPKIDSTKKSQIMAWLAYWPFSMIWFAFHDLFRRLLESIYRNLRHFYRITFESAMPETLSDYRKAEELAGGGKPVSHGDDDDDDDDDDRSFSRRRRSGC